MQLKSHWSLTIPYAVSSLFNLLLPLVLVRLLPIPVMGRYKIYFLYFSLGQWLFLGPSIRGAIPFWMNSPQSRDAQIQSAWTLLFFSSLGISILLILLHPWLTPRTGLGSLEWTLLSITLPFLGFGTFVEEVWVTEGKVRQAGALYAFFEILKTVTILAFSFWIFTHPALLESKHLLIPILAIFTGVSVLKWVYVWSRVHKHPYFVFRPLSLEMKQVWQTTLPIYLAAGAGVLLSSFDQVWVSRLVSPQEFAFYSLGCLSLPPLLLFEQSVNRILIPQLASWRLQSQDRSTGVQLYSDAIEELATFLIPSVFALFLFAEPVVHLLFTPRYLSAVPYLRMYSFDYLCLMIPWDAWARATGNTRWILNTSLFFSLGAVFLGFWATRSFGAFGALSVLLLSHASLRLYSLLSIKRQQAQSIRDLLPLSPVFTITRNALIAAISCWMIHPFFSSPIRWFLWGAPLFALLSFIPTRFERRKRRRQALQKAQRASVLILTQFLRIGGLEKVILQIARENQKVGQRKIFIFAYEENPESSPFREILNSENLSIEWFQKEPGFSWRVIYQILKLVLKYDIQILHSHDLNPLIYGALAKILSGGRVSLVHTQHTFLDLDPSSPHSTKHRLYHRIFSRVADSICTVSQALKIIYENLGIQPSRVRVIPNGASFPSTPSHPSDRLSLLNPIPEKHLKEALLRRSHTIWILCLGRITPQKGQHHVLEIWNHLRSDTQKRATLLFVGPKNNLSTHFSLKGLSFDGEDSGIFFLGPTLHPERWIQESDLLLSASEFEGLPLAPLETLGAGRPAFLSDIPGHQIFAPWAELFALEHLDQAAKRLSEHILRLSHLRGDVNSYAAFYRKAFEKASPLRDRHRIETMIRNYGETYDCTRIELHPGQWP